jgi:hypothetical protein
MTTGKKHAPAKAGKPAAFAPFRGGQSLAHPQANRLHRQGCAGKPGDLRAFAATAPTGRPKSLFPPGVTPARRRPGSGRRLVPTERG